MPPRPVGTLATASRPRAALSIPLATPATSSPGSSRGQDAFSDNPVSITMPIATPTRPTASCVRPLIDAGSLRASKAVTTDVADHPNSSRAAPSASIPSTVPRNPGMYDIRAMMPPPVDGAPEVSTGIAPVSDSVPVTNNATLAGQDWGGSPDANANAAAWAAYQQQQYAYHPQYSGGEWSAYHTACAAQWQQHNEAQAAAAAAGPSQEQLARVAAMFAEKLAAVENERGAGAASKGSVGTKPACTNTPQTETQVDVTTEKHRNRKSVNDLTGG